MSLVGVNKLVRSVQRDSDAAQLLTAEPAELLARFPLDTEERAAILDLDAARLVELGVNPLLVRSLLVTAGVANPDIYTHDLSLRTRTERI